MVLNTNLSDVISPGTFRKFRLRVRDTSGAETPQIATVNATVGSSRDEETFIGVTDNTITVPEVSQITPSLCQR